MKGQVILKPILESDAPILYEIFLTSRPDLCHVDIVNTAQGQILLKHQFELSQMYTHESEIKTRFMIYIEYQAIGKLYLKHEETCVEVVSIAILPQHRNLGIGKFVLQELIAQAIVDNKMLKLRVSWYNKDAKRLYERLGFVETIDYQVYCEMCHKGSPL